jgi:hypothetical protein
VKTAISVYIGLNHSASSFVDREIIRVTAPGTGFGNDDCPTHALVLFGYDDGTFDYAEAFLGEDWAVGLPIERLQAFAAQPGNWCKVFQVPVDAYTANAIRIDADTFVGIWSYSIRRLLDVLAYRETGLQLPLSLADVDCSEAATQLLWPAFWLDLLNATQQQSPAYVAPVDLLVAARTLNLLVTDLAAVVPQKQ